MGRIFAGSSDILVDEFDFSGVNNSITIDITNTIADVTAIEDTDQTFVEGKPSWKITLNGLYSLASPDYDAEMFIDLTSANRLITVSPAIAAATGGTAYFGRGDITSRPIISNITEAVMLNVTWDGDKPLVRGKFAYVNTALGSGDTDGTAFQLGTLSVTQQLIAFQHVLSVAGTSTPTLTTTIYSDDQQGFAGSPSLRVTFAPATAVTSERKTVVGLVNDDWWRVEMAVTGTDPVFSVVIGFGITSYNA